MRKGLWKSLKKIISLINRPTTDIKNSSVRNNEGDRYRSENNGTTTINGGTNTINMNCKSDKTDGSVVAVCFVVIFIVVVVIAFTLLYIIKSDGQSEPINPKSSSDMSSEKGSSNNSSDNSPDSSNPSQPHHVLISNRAFYKQSYLNLEERINNALPLSVVSNVDCVELINGELTNYFANSNEFPPCNLSYEEKNRLNESLDLDTAISPIFSQAKEYSKQLGLTHNRLYYSNAVIEPSDISDYTRVIGKYEEIIQKKEIPYVIYSNALARFQYVSVLSKQSDSDLFSFNISCEDIVKECKESLYLFIYDLSFEHYEYKGHSFNHSSDQVYYFIANLYTVLAKLSDNDRDRAIYNSCAIYYYKNCNLTDDENYSPTRSLDICYDNLANNNYCRKYKDRYKLLKTNKAI